MCPSTPPSGDALVAHAAFVRAVALATLQGDDLVDDVVQDTYVTALERDDVRRGPLRPWLGGIVRRKAMAARRRRAALRQRDRRAARAEATAGTADVAERTEAIRRVVEAVLALPEPYRDVIVLRFYDDLPPREVAKRLDVPVETVRTRIRRGLERLREHLEGDARASKRDWRALLVPLVEVPRMGSAAALGWGVVTMSKLAWLFGGLAVLILLGFVVWGGAEDLPRDEGRTPESAIVAEGGVPEDPTLVGREGDIEEPPTPPAVVARAPDGPPVYPALVRPPSRVEVRVRDVLKRPVIGAEIELKSTSLPEFALLRVGDDRRVERRGRSEGGGRFTFEDLPAGPYLLQARKGTDRSPWLVVAAHPRPKVEDLTFEKAKEAAAYPMRVVDENGEGVGDVRVEIQAASDGRKPVTGEPEPFRWSGVSEADGNVPWPAWPAEWILATAQADDGRVGAFVLQRGRYRFGGYEIPEGIIVLGDAGTIEGEVRAQEGVSLEGCWVEAHLRTSANAYWSSLTRVWRVPLDGTTYEVTGLPRGTYEIVLGGGRLLARHEWRQDGRYPQLRRIEVAAGATVRADLEAMHGAVVHGSVTSPTGPLADAWVRAIRDPKSPNEPDGVHRWGANVWRFDGPFHGTPDHPLTHRTARTDASGRFRMGGLQPGTYRLEVGADGHELVQRFDLDVRETTPVELDLRLDAAGVLQGMAPGVNLFGARRVGEEHFRAVAILPFSGLFTFAGLPAGEYEIGTGYLNTEHTVIGKATIVAGRTTWLDLTNAGGYGVRGRLLVDGEPVAGAACGQGWWGNVQSDDEGFFDLRWTMRMRAGGPVFVRRSLPLGGDQLWTLVHPAAAGDEVAEIGTVELGRHDLRIHVADERGEGVASQVSVRFWPREDEPAPTAEQPVKVVTVSTSTNAQGRVVVDGLRAHDRYVVMVQLPSGLELKEEVAVPTDEEVRFTAPSVGRLEVVVFDHEGNRAPDAMVLVWTWRGEGEPPEDPTTWGKQRDAILRKEARTDAKGFAAVEAVPSGAIYVQAWLPMSFRGRQEGIHFYAAKGVKQLDLASGQTRKVELRIP